MESTTDGGFVLLAAHVDVVKVAARITTRRRTAMISVTRPVLAPQLKWMDLVMLHIFTPREVLDFDQFI